MVTMNVAAWHAAHRAFLADPGKWDCLVEWARAIPCLPIYRDWTTAYGLTSTGTLLAFEDDGPPRRHAATMWIVTELLDRNIALIQGMERYPWLRPLLPERPTDAVACGDCETIRLLQARMPAIICRCGGAGWLPAGASP